MRIQHNISALNSYRNYTNNTNMVSKNLEKLSSGYRINRAGDDAAGLAISEKMRAQITGLATAQKNAQDGVSLVQTAEGAMTEIHSMLNRMTELATQSSNGTYSDAVDRENIQEEYNALAAEIDRIADATNFNGINLLDGTLGGGGKGGAIDGLTTTPHDATLTTATISLGTGTFKNGDTLKWTITYQDEKGKTQTTTLEATYTSKAAAGSGATNGYFTVNGKRIDVDTAAADQIAATTMASVFEAAFKADSGLSETFKLSYSGTAGDIQLEAKEAGANIQVQSISKNYDGNNGITGTWSAAGITATAGADAYESFKFDSPASTSMLDKVFTINGKKFAIAKDADSAAKMDKDVNVIVAGSANGVSSVDVKNLVGLIEQQTGYKAEIDTTDATGMTINFKGLASGKGGGSGEGITLQIGDTADEFNQLKVSVSDMHAAALGVDGLNLLDQDSAKDSINVIKDAINTVSAARGKLGAAQNRLEHTINNLSVTEENMSAAESRIRDTDVAKEMMSYTKNNILVQSAQAMLAQANQTPQGVLQLLQ